MLRHTYVAYTLFNGDIDLATQIIKKTVKRRRTWTLSRKRSSSRFGEGLVWWVWVVPWLVLRGGMEGVTGVPIPNCNYAGPGARDCGIRQAVDSYIHTGGNYGPIQGWDTSLVTDMSYLFYLKSTFNQNISAWDVSKVINMAYSKFTPPLLLSIGPVLFLILSFLFLSCSLSLLASFFFFGCNHTCILLQCSILLRHSTQIFHIGILLG